MKYETIAEITTAAKLKYINKLKGKYWNVFSRELAKRIPEEFKELWENNSDRIKPVLKKISTDGHAVIFKDDRGIIRVASEVNEIIDPSYPEAGGGKTAMITYYAGVGTLKEIKVKLLLPSEHGKSWLLLYNNEKDRREQPISDIDTRNIFDSFSIGSLAEYGAAIYFLSTTAKGIIELMKNSKNEEINEENLTKALHEGIFINDAALPSQGKEMYSKVVGGSKMTSQDNLNVINWGTAADYKIHQENLLAAELEFFSDKGLKEFKKNGTYNAHTEEIKGMQEDKVGGMFDKVIHIEKNVSAILTFIEKKEIKFKFDLEIEAPMSKQEPEQKNIEEVQNEN